MAAAVIRVGSLQRKRNNLLSFSQPEIVIELHFNHIHKNLLPFPI